MFLGEYQTKFTGKGRVILPKKIRLEVLGGKIILSRGFEGCIWGFSEEGFEKESKQLLEGSPTEERARLLRRYLFSASSAVELDAQNRFVIPGALLDFAKLKDSVVVIGAGDHFELWNVDLWKSHIREVERVYGK